MNYYGSYSGNRKKKTVRRVIIIVVCAVLIFVSTVIFGNHLKKKSADTGTEDYGGIGREDVFADTESPIIIPPSEEGAGTSETVQGACVMIGRTDSKDGSFAERIVNDSDGYTGVLVPLTGDNGLLLYGSTRASAASRLPADPGMPNTAAVAEAVTAAHAKGLRVTAYVKSAVDLNSSEAEYSEAILADSRIAADAAEAGFDEIIISGLVSSKDDITGESSHIILRYLNQMIGVAGNTKVGLALPMEIYQVATLSPQIELFVSRSVFLAMEQSSEESTVEHLNYICENLAGTMSVYNMRMLFSPADSKVAGGIKEKLRAVEHNNYMFTSVSMAAPPAAEEVTDSTGKNDKIVTEDN